MFQLPRALRVTPRQPPHAFEWWERSFRQDDQDQARFFALAAAFALKLEGTLTRDDTQDQEILTVGIPIADRPDHHASPAPFLEPVVVGQAAMF
jgi:hypothetical protein